MPYEFICKSCHSVTLDEDEVTPCEGCGLYMCNACLTTIEHQGYSEAMCMGCDPKATRLT